MICLKTGREVEAHLQPRLVYCCRAYDQTSSCIEEGYQHLFDLTMIVHVPSSGTEEQGWIHMDID